MNAFLIFCKRHRSSVRDIYPHLENRSITKILGEWWANLELKDKNIYVDLAKQYKEAFMTANPNFQWVKVSLTSPHAANSANSCGNTNSVKVGARVSLKSSTQLESCGITPDKLADELKVGGISSPMAPVTPSASFAKPPKKRYIEKWETKEAVNSAAGMGMVSGKVFITEPQTQPLNLTSEVDILKFGQQELINRVVNMQCTSEKRGHRLGNHINEMFRKRIESVSENGASRNSDNNNKSSKDSFDSRLASDSSTNNSKSGSGATGVYNSTKIVKSFDSLNVSAGEEKKESSDKENSKNEEKVPDDVGSSSQRDVNQHSNNKNNNKLPSKYEDVKDVFKFDDHADSEEFSRGSPTTMAHLRRKSQRSCKGKRYQEYVTEGVIQLTRERKPSTGSSGTPFMGTQSSDGSGGGGISPGIDYQPPETSYQYPPRKRSPSDEPPSTSPQKQLMENPDKRARLDNFDLEKRIAALPKCDMPVNMLTHRRKYKHNPTGRSPKSIPSSATNNKKTTPTKPGAAESIAREDQHLPRRTGSEEELNQHSDDSRCSSGGDSSTGTSPNRDSSFFNTMALQALAEAAVSEKERMAK